MRRIVFYIAVFFSSILLAQTSTTTIQGNLKVKGLAGSGARLVYTLPSGLFQDTTLSPAGIGFANPSASIGLSAVNGDDTTAMRSDAAPALSQAIVPTWTGLHTFNNSALIGSGDFLYFDATSNAGRMYFLPGVFNDLRIENNDSDPIVSIGTSAVADVTFFIGSEAEFDVDIDGNHNVNADDTLTSFRGLRVGPGDGTDANLYLGAANRWYMPDSFSVFGTMMIGDAFSPVRSIALEIAPDDLPGGGSQSSFGLYADPVFSTDLAAAYSAAFELRLAAAVTPAEAAAVLIRAPVLGAGAGAAVQVGLGIANQGATNYAIKTNTGKNDFGDSMFVAGLGTFNGSLRVPIGDSAYFGVSHVDGYTTYKDDTLFIGNKYDPGEEGGALLLHNVLGSILLDENGNVEVNLGTAGIFPGVTNNMPLGSSSQIWSGFWSDEATLVDNLFFSDDIAKIRQTTSDASDTGLVAICGGGDCATTRGAYATFDGNEASGTGTASIYAPASGAVQIRVDGDLLLDASNNLITLGNGALSVTATTVTANENLIHEATTKTRSTLSISSGNIAVDAALSDFYSVTLTTNCTLSNPTNDADGRHFTVRVRQDGTGSRTLAYGTQYRFPGGTAPTLTTTANATDYLSFIYHSTDDTWDYIGNAFNYAAP